MSSAAALLLLLVLPLASQGVQVHVEAEPDPEKTPSHFEGHIDNPKYWTQTGPAAGDPKLQDLAGRRFQIHRPGEFSILRIPNEKKHHGDLLEIRADVQPNMIGDPCLLFIKKITIGGSWFGGNSWKVRAQGAPGNDNEFFGIRWDKKKHEGHWRNFANMTGWEEVLHKDEKSGRVTTVKSVIGRREGRAQDIKGPYEHRFLIGVGMEGQKEKKTVIDIWQAKPGRQYVNIKVEHLSSLKRLWGVGSHDIEGLLGVDSHNGTEVRDECKDGPEHVKASELLGVSGGMSRASAHWA